MLAGKAYDFVNFFAQKPDETVFVSSTEPKIGKHPYILFFCLMSYEGYQQ